MPGELFLLDQRVLRINRAPRSIVKSKHVGQLRRGMLPVRRRRLIQFRNPSTSHNLKHGSGEVLDWRRAATILTGVLQLPHPVTLAMGHHRNEILNQVWGNEVIVGDRTIDVHIRKIRQKLGLDCITTVKGVGYKFNL